MRRIEELAKVVKRDGKWKRQVVEYWLWCDEETKAICKLLKINRPLLNRWHRWHFRTRQKIIKAPKWEVPPQIILWQKRQEMKNKKDNNILIQFCKFLKKILPFFVSSYFSTIQVVSS